MVVVSILCRPDTSDYMYIHYAHGSNFNVCSKILKLKLNHAMFSYCSFEASRQKFAVNNYFESYKAW
jgi:hypothetical protein